jgi:dolichol-phosphate mannosyltransferase
MTRPEISIVIPTWNEQDNVQVLVETIHKTFSLNQIEYELIFIDDYSTDKTVERLRKLAGYYPISIYMKRGERGKAESLVQGFSNVRFHLIAMIDADMQYHPKYLPDMIKKIKNENYDIVVAERNEQETGLLRRLISRSFAWLFVRMLHGLNIDAQSGMKVFRKEVLKHVHLTAKGWAFDMDFLIQAKDAGFKITGIPIVFEKRFSGEAKINLFSASWQIGLDALRLKHKSVQVNNFDKQGHGTV